MLLSDAALDTNIVPKHMTSQQLVEGTVWLLNRLYRPRAFLERLGVFAAQLPLESATPREAIDPEFWRRVATSFAGLGSEMGDVPLAAARLFAGRDMHGLRTALVFYRSAVGVLRRWGVWDPRLAERAAPEFSG